MSASANRLQLRLMLGESKGERRRGEGRGPRPRCGVKGFGLAEYSALPGRETLDKSPHVEFQLAHLQNNNSNP
jgi:hypothetical protein